MPLAAFDSLETFHRRYPLAGRGSGNLRSLRAGGFRDTRRMRALLRSDLQSNRALHVLAVPGNDPPLAAQQECRVEDRTNLSRQGPECRQVSYGSPRSLFVPPYWTPKAAEAALESVAAREAVIWSLASNAAAAAMLGARDMVTPEVHNPGSVRPGSPPAASNEMPTLQGEERVAPRDTIKGTRARRSALNGKDHGLP